GRAGGGRPVRGAVRGFVSIAVVLLLGSAPRAQADRQTRAHVEPGAQAGLNAQAETGARGREARVAVSALSKHAPAWISIEGPRRLLVRAGATGLVVDGAAAEALALPEARWRLRGEGFDRS